MNLQLASHRFASLLRTGGALVPILWFGAGSAGVAAPLQEAESAITAQDSDPEAPADERADKIKRVLRLTGGGHVRTLSYFADGQWNLRRDGKWLQLDEDSVLSWRSEAQLESEARKLSRALGAKDHGRRVELARWMMSEGLVEEATEEIDRVLHLEPDFEPAIALLDERAFPKPRPHPGDADPTPFVKNIVAAGVSAGPVDRELLIHGLIALQAREGGPEVLRDVLRAELRSPRILRRTFAAHALRRLEVSEEREVFAIMQRCILDTSRPVREEAARALSATDTPGIVAPLVKALDSDSRAVRTNAAESLGNVGFATAVPALVSHFNSLPQSGGSSMAKVAAHIYIGSHYAYVGDFDLEIAQGASIADPIVMQGQEAKILDARLAGISGYTYRTEYRSVSTALKQLTGANPGSSPSDWQRWYDENRERFESKGSELPE